MAEPLRAPAAPLKLVGGRFLIVEARYYDAIGAMLLEGARDAFAAAEASVEVIGVPGALEIPGAISIALDGAKAAGRPFDGAVALGCVIRGETFHFEIVSGESARAIMDLTVVRHLALGNGILTVDTQAQALARSGPDDRNKGAAAARAALAMAALKRKLA